MPLDQALLERNCAPGSTPYYCVRFSPASRQEELRTILAWYCEIGQLPLRVSEVGVAHTKLQWWQDELQRAVRQGSQLPLAGQLSQIIHQHEVPLNLCDSIMATFRSDLMTAPHAQWDALQAYCNATGGGLAELLSRVCGVTDQQELDVARDLGRFVRWVEVMRDLGATLRRGRTLMPPLSEQHEALSEGEAITAQLAEAARQAREHYSECTEKLPMKPQPGLIPVFILAELAWELLQTLESSDFQVLDQRISLTPLKKMWIAWRTGARGSLKKRRPL